MFTKEEISREYEALTWQVPGTDMVENRFDLQQGQLPVLFRGHDVLSPHSLSDSNLEGIIHATPHMEIAMSPWKFRLNRHYQDFPGNCGFVSVYSATPEQKFYPDETLELVTSGRLPDNGIALGGITTFDRVQHFETSINSNVNHLLATYFYRHDGLGKNRRIALVPDEDSVLFQVMIAKAKTPQASIVLPRRNSLTPSSAISTPSSP